MTKIIHQAIILSAGLGTRLQEITQGKIPKVMVPLEGKPLLEWHIEALKKHGISEFFINLHYLPDVITEHFGDGSKFGVKINYFLEQPEILGTAGGIKDFEDSLGDYFFVLYGDTFYQLDYSELKNLYFSKKDAIGVGTVRKTDHPEDSDLAIVGENHEVKEFLIKPHSQDLLDRLIRSEKKESGSASISDRQQVPVRAIPRFYGMSAPYLFSKKILEYIPKNKYYEIDHNLVPDLLSKGFKYYAYQLQAGEWRKDIGTVDRYHFVENYLKNLK
ncbi:MAG: NDP-sugar synthase [Candidatus Liptonbacteria bacterium]|nr:NDP-sugar synthase [Candidatus Liptonbacteria bacterium]